MEHRNIEFKQLRDENPALVDAVVEHMRRHGLQCVQGWEGVYIRLLDEARSQYIQNHFELAKANCHAAIYVAGCGGGIWHLRFSKKCIAVINRSLFRLEQVRVMMRARAMIAGYTPRGVGPSGLPR